MKKCLLLSAAISLLAFHAVQAATEITIYNQNLALIKKSQKVLLKQGENEVVFDEVAQELRPESAYIFGDGIRVSEQNYDYAGINYMTMLNANVGKKVKTVRQNPSTGANIYEEALLVAADGMTPVLKFDYGIETNFPGRVLFDSVPPELNSTPVLMAKVMAKKTAETDLYLLYLAGGFSWKANYVAKVNDKETLSLLGRAAVSNNSGSSYGNVKVNLIAGDVNVVNEYERPRMLKAAFAARGATVDNMVMEEAVMDMPSALDGYYIYNIPEKTTLKNGQIKQVSFVSAPKVKYNKEGVLQSSLYFGTSKSAFKDVHPNVYYHFMNNADDGLGMPLPQGKISFYAPDDKGSLQFIGENRIDNKAEGQKISLQLGQFFDVFGEGKIIEVTKTDEKQYQKKDQKCPTLSTKYRYDVNYVVKNMSEDTVHLVLKQNLNGQAKVVKESLQGQNGDGNVYEWHFDMVPKGSQVITVEVENTLEKTDCNLVDLSF